ncbi:MAG: hypothetical protein ACIAXF_10290 [Phycisphaerales bacterium JB063]
MGDALQDSAGVQIDPEQWPRVLFVSPCAFNGVTGGGVTFSNLFRGWPKDRLACVTSDTVAMSFEVCERYFMLGSAERRRGWPWSLVAPVREVGGEVLPKQKPEAPGEPRPSSVAQSLARRVLGSAGPPEYGVLSARLRDWVEAFRPEVLYTILGDTVMIDLVERLADAFDLPVVVHCMDEGVTEPARTGLYGSGFNARYRAGFARLVDRAADRLAICDAMAEAYAQRYARPFAAFHNAVDFASIAQRHRRAEVLRQDPPRLLYAGSIYPVAQDRSLLDCCAAVARLNASGTRVELHVHASRSLFGRYASQVEAHAGCTFHDALDEDRAFFEAITSADVLLLPVNFDEASARFIGLSMPTKVPAYLASGTPTLVYGPRGVAQVRAALDDGWGLVVDQHTPPGPEAPGPLDDAIARLLGDGALREQLAVEAATLAAEHHDAAVVRRRFRDTLGRAAKT